MEKLNYQNEDIHVYLVRGKEAPKSIREASAALPVPDRRTSKRSRRTTTGNSISLKVSGSTTVYQLKLMIWESLGVCHTHRNFTLCKQPSTDTVFLLHFIYKKEKTQEKLRRKLLLIGMTPLDSVSAERSSLNKYQS